ncbi:potassium voltage-gated channel protein Shaw-like isoform X2 [Pomacea canaliculata]|uniref:potassium voltage-gated channel protein Shaw-like isoform X2 n=1 Tax=Pomacea canaliculata TaxID=400727 RepID=UPI000D736FCD|nr:potassium voltage-gated channel protein Shaw-like isoform X2 [Pomacea canaliculata]
MDSFTGSRSKYKQSVLNALLPGASIQEPGRILTHVATGNETVVFNVGGTMFETYKSTLHSLPHSPLADDSFLRKHFRQEKGHYFFDRDPDVFCAILNYLRTGELHLPTKCCGPAVKTELEFWGIEEDEIEECCWTNYNSWTTTLDALRRLEQDRKVNMPGSQDDWPEVERSHSKVRELQIKFWNILHNPRSSLLANLYGYVSLTFVIISIFSFVAQTHEFFRVPSHHKAANLGSKATHPITHNTSSANVTAEAVVLNRQNITKGLTEVHPVLLGMDGACLVFFIAEFACRFFLSPRKLKMLAMPTTVIDLLALLPDIIEFSIRIFRHEKGQSTVDVITNMRLLRTFRIFRLMRHFPGLWILFYTLKASLRELLLLLLFVFVGMIFFASLIHYADDQTVFTSIPTACWWAVITMTTVGYGDMYPTTRWGYVVGTLTAICGVLVVGFTVPVLVNNFILYYQHTQCAFSRDRATKRRAHVNKQRRQCLEKRAQGLHERVPEVQMSVLKCFQNHHTANGQPGPSCNETCRSNKKTKKTVSQSVEDGTALLEDEAELSTRQNDATSSDTADLAKLLKLRVT